MEIVVKINKSAVKFNLIVNFDSISLMDSEGCTVIEGYKENGRMYVNNESVKIFYFAEEVRQMIKKALKLK
jgi:hypothetical protein